MNKMIALSTLLYIFTAVSTRAESTLLIEVEDNGDIVSGNYDAVSQAIEGGYSISVTYIRPGRVFQRQCSSVVDLPTAGKAYCFVTDAVDTVGGSNSVEFASRVAIEYIIINTDGERQTVKHDVLGNQIAFEDGNCDGMMVCTDDIRVMFYSHD